MQLGNNIYIDISFTDMEVQQFLTPSDVIDFKIVETAGASLPFIYMVILVSDERVKEKFVANNELKISVGENAETADTFTITPIAPNPNKDPSGSKWRIEFLGFIGNKEYMFNIESKAYIGNSLFVVNQVMKDYFGKKAKEDYKNQYFQTPQGETIGYYMSTNFSGTNENQVIWRRHKSTAAYFVADVLLHADVRPSFPLFAFDRYGNFYVRDLYRMYQDGPKVTFSPLPPKNKDYIRYYNNFNAESYKTMYNLYSGLNKVTEICDSLTGNTTHERATNKPILASSSISEILEGAGHIESLNNIQSSNVHKTYNIAYAHNTNQLVALSSMIGVIELIGSYHKNLVPTDLVNLELGEKTDKTLSGSYLIDTVVTSVDFKAGRFKTYVYLTRDNKNNIENYVPNKKTDWIKIKDKLYTDLLNAISNLKIAYAMGMEFIDGRFMSRVLSFAIETKNNLLRSFNISGVMLDLADYYMGTLNSLIATGNSILNTLFDMIFPYQIANSLRDLVTMERTSIGVVGKYVSEYVPIDAQEVVMRLVESLYGVTDTLNSIRKDNKTGGTTVAETTRTDYIAEGQQRVNNIITSFENNTTGLDIPFPIVELTESQALLSDEELAEMIANETIVELENSGYLAEEDAKEFQDILLGNEPINFSIIEKINRRAGDTMNYRFWGVFGGQSEPLYAWSYRDNYIYTKSTEITETTRLYNRDFSPYIGIEFKVAEVENQWVIVYNNESVADRDSNMDIISDELMQLSSFYIKDSYRDKYRTIPCTKLISATKGAKIFFACPVKEENIKFYINSRRVELGYFPIDLGYTDIYGNPVYYNVYYTTEGYNSNSVLFEVKQGGMV